MKHTNFISKPLRRATWSLLTLGLLVGAAGCEVTDLTPSNVTTEETAFTTPDRVALAVVGMYDAAQSGFYDPLNGTALGVRGYPFGAASTELGDMRGEDMVNTAGFYGIVYENQQTSSSPNVVNMWSNSYAVVNKANNVIDGVRQAGAAGVIPTAAAAAYEGEARFLRALSHFELILHFSRPYLDGNGDKLGVPYRDFAVNSATSVDQARAQGRGTVAEDYTKILADLKFAEDNLPATRDASLKITRATKGAAIALKTRVLLAQGAYDAVVTEGNKLVPTAAPFTSSVGGYALTPTVAGPFVSGAPIATIPTEAIFYIENSATDNASVNGALPSMYGNPNSATAGPSNPFPGIGGRGLISVSPDLYKAPFFLATDLRKTQLITRDANLYYTNKYKSVAEGSDATPLIRYAEVLLNVAEAESRKGNETRALALLNAVRNRAVTTAADQYTAANAPKGTALTQAILNERRIEFLGEGRRWYDIHRLSVDPTPALKLAGIPEKIRRTSIPAGGTGYTTATVPKVISAIPYSNNLFIWPIPAQELANNPTLAKQPNPGY